jgi:hypothetical protein
MSLSGDAPNGKSRWHSLGWFVLLWAGGVLVTLAVASVFKFLILSVVKH